MKMTKLQRLLNNIPNQDQSKSEQIPLLEKDIVHYLRTETDKRRLAYWCEQYLKLDL
jgi:hypothetical protein